MDITLSQHKLKSADLANQMASAGAIKLPAAASTRPGNFSVLENVRVNVPPVLGVAPFTLEKHNSAPLMQVPGKLSVGLPTPEFKVPKAMVPSTIAGAGNGNLNSSRSMGLSANLRMASDIEVSTGFSSKALSQELQENSKVNLRKLASENETMNAAMTMNKSLQLDSNKPDSSSTLQEKSEADTNKSSEKIVEKRRRLVSKRKEHGLECMAVNNMEQLVRDETERKKEHGEKRVDVETPAAMPAFSDQRSNGASKTSLLRTGAADKREENSQSQETSILSGKKRKKSKAKTDKLEIGVKDSDPLLNNALSNVDKATFAEVVGLLQDEVDPMVSVMKVEKAPLESYADIRGLDSQIQEIKEAVELPLTHPELYEDIGIKPPKGVILYGEPGTGKTLLAKAVANSTLATFLRVVGSELIQKYLGYGP
ncbi:hypothetical protein CY35_20G008800 [Sphagnum magellanicum]|nr:hypothetical protein CY35_20G008800 [Sphagnum magellanicum]